MTDTLEYWLEIIIYLFFLYIFVVTQGQRLPEVSGLINPAGIWTPDPQISSQMPWPLGHSFVENFVDGEKISLCNIEYWWHIYWNKLNK